MQQDYHTNKSLGFNDDRTCRRNCNSNSITQFLSSKSISHRRAASVCQSIASQLRFIPLFVYPLLPFCLIPATSKLVSFVEFHRALTLGNPRLIRVQLSWLLLNRPTFSLYCCNSDPRRYVPDSDFLQI